MRKLIVIGLVSVGALTACTKLKPVTEASLPERDVKYMGSMAVNLYYKVRQEAPLALGQVFLIPEGHGILKTVKFYLSPYPMPAKDPSARMFIKLRVSPWEDDRPSSSAIWESEPAAIKRDFNGWLNFDVPRVKLQPGKKYIAWLAFADLENPDDAALSVVTQGLQYPLGMRATWMGSNPNGSLQGMTENAWKTEALGNNLHFKMVFVNK